MGKVDITEVHITQYRAGPAFVKVLLYLRLTPSINPCAVHFLCWPPRSYLLTRVVSCYRSTV